MWLSGIQSAASFTFDVDAETAWSGEGLSWGIPYGAYGAKVGTSLILSVLEKHAIKGTFFVPGLTAERYPHLVEAILGAGHEIGAHGYTHNPPNSMTAEKEEEELVRSLEILRRLGANPVGWRTPWAMDSQNTNPLLKKYGFLYLSTNVDSLMPYRYSETDLLEIPCSFMADDWDAYGYGGGRWPNPPNSALMELWGEEFEGIHELGAVFVPIMHPQNTGRPARLKFLDRLIEFVQGHSGVWITTCGEIANYVEKIIPRNGPHE